MPLINGMKMACEPCIRGHRSTKCTHANERLMVPVRKPGRPLSQCPHPGGQACMCGSVTAAIPRKQTCRCGDGASPALAAQIVPRTPSSQGGADAPSPTKTSFKIQKASRPQSSRKQSFDPANFERMDMNSVNILPFEQRSQAVPIAMALPEGYAVSAPPSQMYGYVPQYANIQPQYNPIPMQPPPIPHEIQTNGFTNGNHSRNGSYTVESPSTPTIQTNGTNQASNGGSCCASKAPINGTNGDSENAPVATNGGSCCAPKRKSHSHSSSNSSNSSEPQEPQAGSCCSAKPAQPKEEPASINGTPLHMSPVSPNQVLPQPGMPFNPALYQQFLPPATIFTYPATYGSFQNPLQPSAWRQGFHSNNYSQPQPPVSLPPGSLPFDTPPLSGNMDTVHRCSCGETCQCIGCAAHPYNDATQDYVRSAWASMSLEPPGDLYTNGHPPPNTNGETPVQPQAVDQVSSPAAHTPSSTTSGTGEEQSLSASDFFFVNYPFTGDDGCGGDTMSCPCGDDCQCLGCTIHRQPSMPCSGEKESCPCGDNCECIGCSVHNGGTVAA